MTASRLLMTRQLPREYFLARRRRDYGDGITSLAGGGRRFHQRRHTNHASTPIAASGTRIPVNEMIPAMKPTKFRHACLNASPSTPLSPRALTTGKASWTVTVIVLIAARVLRYRNRPS